MELEKLEVHIKDFELEVAEFMRETSTPGMAFQLIHGSKVIYSRGFGHRDFKQFKPFDINTLNGFASCTKSFTSLAILLLEKEGKLDRHDPVSKYLPFELGSEINPITLHHLMSHTSGIPDMSIYGLTALRLIPRDIDQQFTPMATWEDFYLHINGASDELIYKPGEHFYYFNGGYTMLSHVIELVSGMEFHEFIKRRILDPLMMERSRFLRGEDANIALSYIGVPQEGKRPFPQNVEFPFNKFLHGPGGLVSSVNEMGRYISMTLNGGKVDEKPLFDPALLSSMQEYHWTEPTGSSEFGTSGYGYGWGINDNFLGYKMISHTGGITGGSSIVGFLPELKLGFVGIGTGNFAFQQFYGLLARLLGKTTDELKMYSRPEFLKKLTGSYVSYKGNAKRKVVLKYGTLHLIEEGLFSSEMALIPENDDAECTEFVVLNPNGTRIPVEFHVTDERTSLILMRYLLHKQ